MFLRRCTQAAQRVRRHVCASDSTFRLPGPRRHNFSGKVDSLFKSQVGDIMVESRYFTIDEDATVFDATKQMVDNDIGSVIVTRNNGARMQVVGIMTERDYLTKVVHRGVKSSEISVKTIATVGHELLVTTADDSVQHCLDVMLAKDVRHIPVVSTDGYLRGVVSVRDLAKELQKDPTPKIKTISEFLTPQ